MRSGSEAKRGDTVRNLTTGETRTMYCASNSGRIVVSTDGCSPGEKWERWNVGVVERFDAFSKDELAWIVVALAWARSYCAKKDDPTLIALFDESAKAINAA